MTECVDLVTRSLADDAGAAFDRRVDEQAARLREELRDGRLDNPGFALGLELESYAVDADGCLARLPDGVFEAECDRELGLHNAELHTTPTPFDGDGIAAQAEQLRRRFRNARRATRERGLELVPDAMWTLPPEEGSEAYLGAVRERSGVTIAENMAASPRYWAIDNDVLRRAGGAVSVTVPGVDREFPSILVESLTSSIQPHLQVPDAATFPRYHAVAVRTLGPVLALATNSPLAPADLYDVDDPYGLLEETYHELRIPVFEQSVNTGWEKVRFPEPVDDPVDPIDHLVADPTCAPFLREWLADDERETFADRYWELDHKRGTYWRWIRAVIGGQPVGGGDRRSIRIEYRPLPTQPTIADTVGLLCLVGGLIRGLVAADHPIDDLEPEAAERSFYDAVERGLEADLAWITADGERTSERETIYGEVFAFARRGLREQGVTEDAIDEYLAPIEARWEQRRTPSEWKVARVRDALEGGASFADAVREMQTEYVERAGTGEPFSRWS